MAETGIPPWILFAAMAAVVAYVIYLLFSKRKGGKDFKTKPFEKTCVDHHKRDVKDNGIYVKGKLMLGHYPVGKVYKYIIKEGRFSTIRYDERSKKGKVIQNADPSAETFSIYIFQVHPKNIFLKIINHFIGAWWRYYIVDTKAIAFNDPTGNIWQVAEGTAMYHYGGCWISGNKPMELQDGISILASKEAMMTHMENYANRIIWLESQTARKGTIMIAETQAQKAKWDSSKKMDDSTVTNI